MKTLLLSAPRDKDSASNLHRTFESILASHIGPDYAIYRNLVSEIATGMKVVVFDRTARRQAEGAVESLNATVNKTAGGVLRYNVHIRNLQVVQYTNPPNVNRCGVNIV